MEELKKCPFCGGNVKIKMGKKSTIGCTIWCECEKCHAKTIGYCPNMENVDKALESIEECKGKATQAWNRRV